MDRGAWGATVTKISESDITEATLAEHIPKGVHNSRYGSGNWTKGYSSVVFN